MAAALGATIDLLHAALMATWLLGLPLLFLPRWPRLAASYAIYAIVFIVANQVSFLVLGECFLTTLARLCWTRAGSSPSGEWFSVRAAAAVFGMTPSHLAVRRVSEVLILATAVGVLFRGLRGRTRASAHPRRRAKAQADRA